MFHCVLLYILRWLSNTIACMVRFQIPSSFMSALVPLHSLSVTHSSRRYCLSVSCLSCWDVCSYHCTCFRVTCFLTTLNVFSLTCSPALLLLLLKHLADLTPFILFFFPFEERTNHKVTNFMFTPCCSNENASWSGDVVLLTGCTGRRLNKLDKHRDRDNNRTVRVWDVQCLKGIERFSCGNLNAIIQMGTERWREWDCWSRQWCGRMGVVCCADRKALGEKFVFGRDVTWTSKHVVQVTMWLELKGD